MTEQEDIFLTSSFRMKVMATTKRINAVRSSFFISPCLKNMNAHDVAVARI